MNHRQYKEWLQLSMYNELSADEQSRLEKHLQGCDECRRELKELREFHAVLAQAGEMEAAGELLQEARQELRAAIRTERSRPPLWSHATEFIRSVVFPNYKIALGGLILLAGGMVVGRMILPSNTVSLAQNGADRKFATSFDSEPRISNVHFINSLANGNDIEFTFDAISSVHVKGDINDERVQKVLAHAIVNDQNPGVRLRSVSAFATQADNLKRPDKEVKAALVLALKTDENPGVRREALRTLRTFPFDSEIKETFLYVLMHDRNPALRIAAINSLDSARVQGESDNDLRDVLKQRMHSDENTYVRIRAKAVLEETKQQ